MGRRGVEVMGRSEKEILWWRGAGNAGVEVLMGDVFRWLDGTGGSDTFDYFVLAFDWNGLRISPSCFWSYLFESTCLMTDFNASDGVFVLDGMAFWFFLLVCLVRFWLDYLLSWGAGGGYLGGEFIVSTSFQILGLSGCVECDTYDL